MSIRSVVYSVLVPLAVFAGSALGATLQVPSLQYPTIQSAINAAANGDTVLVAPGPYVERVDMKGKSITLKSTAGRTQTFIQPGAAAGGVISCVTGESAGCIIEGFTISGANGPGVAVTSASPVFRLCAINQNYNSSANGGGVAFTGTSGSPRFEDCEFTGNWAVGREGGAMALAATSGTVTCVRCSFSANQSTGSFGGAIYASGTAVLLTECLFGANTVVATLGERQGGAIYSTGTLNASGCVFSQNSVTMGRAPGAEPSARGGAVAASGNVSLVNCTFSGNRAEGPDGWPNNNTGRAWGGAIYLFGTAPVNIVGCTFTANLATIVGGAYGRESRGGAIAIQNGCDPNFTNCTFVGNAAPNTGYGSGGTLWYDGGSFGVMQDCTISGSSTYTEGGAMFLNGGASPTILRTTFANCSTTVAGGNGGAIRAQDAANAYISDCRFTNCSSGSGGAIYTRNSQPFILLGVFDSNTAAGGSAVRTEGAGNTNVPTIQSSFFCSNSGASANWILGNWNNPNSASNSFAASCGADCNVNGILDSAEIAAGLSTDCDNNGQPDDCQADCDGDGVINACEITAGAGDCDANGVPDSCQIAQGAADVNHDGVLDSCVPVDYAGLVTEIVPIAERSRDSTIPATAICYRIYAKFVGGAGAIWSLYGNADFPLSIVTPQGFYNSVDVGDTSKAVPCNLSALAYGARYDSWLTIGRTCATSNEINAVGFDFASFSTQGITDNDCGVVLAPGQAQGFADASGRVLLAQLTSRTGQLPTGLVNLAGWTSAGVPFQAFTQSWPAPTLVDCNNNGVHDAYDIRDGSARDCDESGVPDVCEYAYPNEDCNNNGTPDLCDIHSGASPDANRNNVPDECECAGDVDGDGTVNIDDIVAVILSWGVTGSNPADLDGDLVVGLQDLVLVLNYYGQCQ
jgi:predicted outer membrane repeat protein